MASKQNAMIKMYQQQAAEAAVRNYRLQQKLAIAVTALGKIELGLDGTDSKIARAATDEIAAAP